jgi:predicted DCC family thiol-disulfide oxidoreductase YuxK
LNRTQNTNPEPRTRKRERPYNFNVLVLFDGGCPMCRRTVRRLHRFDWLQRLAFADATDAARRERLAPGLTEAEIMREMYVVERGGRYGGFEGVLRIARVVPLLWPFFVIGSLPGIRQLGRGIYRHIASNRTRQGRCTDEFCVP